MKKLRSDSRGIAHLMVPLILVVVVVVAAIGWYVYTHQKTSPATTVANVVADAAAEKACNDLYKDKDLCKFAGVYNPNAPYKATFTMTAKDGAVTKMTSDSDGKGNSSSVTTSDNKESAAFILLNGDTYMKDEADGSWVKYPKAPESQNVSTPTSDLKIDFKDEAAKTDAQRITYKKLGTEACGSSKCFKYQVIDPSQPNTTSYVWFGTKDYQLHQWSFTDTDGSKSEGTFDYTKVTISVPSPVKQAPSTPSASQIQDMIDSAQ